MLVYPAGSTAACRWTARYLSKQGVATVDHPTPDATHLLLDVPSFSSDGSLRGGTDLRGLLRMLPPKITIVGGNLSDPVTEGHPLLDLLLDPEYQARNAAITADCAMRIAGQHMKITYKNCNVLVLGWGRIGKCLGGLLRSAGAEVTIAARNPSDRAMAMALGYHTVDIPEIPRILSNIRLIFNTVPSPVLEGNTLILHPDCICIELASKPGIIGDHVIQARGLPGLMTPESSGALICETFLRMIGRK